MDKRKNTSRRDFISQTALAVPGVAGGMKVFSATNSGSIAGANNKIRMGFIGVGNRGSQLLRAFMANPDVEVAALCDVYQPYLLRDRARVHPRYLAEMEGQIPGMGEMFARPPETFTDFRKLLERKEIDAVCIATPDHWHAIQTIAALQAGKDIYVEKPLTITLREGRRMVKAAAETDRIVAVGLNRRGSSVYQKLHGTVAEKIGRVTIARAFRINNMYPDGIGNARPEAPPPDLDWDMWLGPRAYRPYQFNIAPYKFRWWKDYSSQMGNWGVHFLDVIRWLMNEQAPTAVTAQGGKYALTDDRTIPDTMEVTFEFSSGSIAVFCIYEANGGSLFEGGEVELRGTKGNLYVSENGYRVTQHRPGQFQQRKQTPAAGGPPPAENRRGAEDLKVREDSTANLIRNFLDCVKSRRQPWCTLEDGHRSTSFAHLANIALEMKTRLEWDPRREEFTNHRKANDLLDYEYRKPWTKG